MDRTSTEAHAYPAPPPPTVQVWVTLPSDVVLVLVSRIAKLPVVCRVYPAGAEPQVIVVELLWLKKCSSTEEPSVLESVTAGATAVLGALAALFVACPPMGEDATPEITPAIMSVALVHVPDVWLVAVATKYAVTQEPLVVPLWVSMVFHAGTVPAADGIDGAVALLRRDAQITIRSPTLCDGMVTDVVAELFDPVSVAISIPQCRPQHTPRGTYWHPK